MNSPETQSRHSVERMVGRNLQIETVSTAKGKMDVIRDIATVRRVLVITERFAAAVRDFPCGHKPNGVGGKCDACEALKEWDALSSNTGI